MGDIVSVKDFGAKGDGVTDDTTLIQNAINAAGEGGTVVVPLGRFMFTNLTVPTGTTIAGQGYFNSVQGTFGDPGYLLTNRTFGSILESTATTGAAITFSNPTFIKDHQLRDIFIIGPGSGTSIGLQVGAVGGLGCIQHDWRNVLVANFSTGIVFENMEDCTYTSLRVRGCNTGIVIGPNVLCTQDVFVNPEVQTCTTCWLIQNASQFQFFGGLNQNYTTGFSLTPNIAGGLVGLQFFGTWMEAGTTAIKLDTTTGPIQNVEFNGTHMSGTSGTFSTAGANAIARLKLDGNDWNTTAVTIPSTSTGAVVMRNRLSSFTDQGTGTFFLDSGVVGSNPISFTPNVGGNATYTAQSGRAIRVGKMVHINGSMTINVIGTGSAATISGLPFAASASPTASATIGISFFSGLTGNVIWIEGQVNPNASSMIFNGLTAAAANMLNAMSIMGNGTRIDFDGWYEAA